MPKLYKITDWRPGLADVYFHCPGCKCDHGVWTIQDGQNHAIWGFNGDFDRPTFNPSILTYMNSGGVILNRCHSFVRDGMIQFLGDCMHELAGQTVELPEV